MFIYNLLLIAFWIIFLLYWSVSALSVKKSAGSVWGQLGIRALIIAALVAIFHAQIFNGPAAHVVPATGRTASTIGVILAGLGIAFAIWARAHLGRNWGMPRTVKKDPELVTSGPYAYIRHPIYTGVLVAVLGSAFVAGSVWLVPFLIFSIYFVYSASVEQKHLMKEFPDTYPAYRKRTKMLIPFIF
jgi:protein-S-isoprenylcysteine O-methyltransferase Ste14